MSDHTFKLQINFTKAYKGEDNVAYIEGIASGPEVDLTGERMSVDALKSMVESLKKRLIEFRDVHEEEWNSDLGEVVELSITQDNRLFYKAKLDLNLSGARDLWYRITEQGKKLGVSVGGSVIKAGYEYVAELGRSIYTYVDVDLSHIGITRQAAYQHSFANAVLKSLTKKEEPMSKPKEVEKTNELAHQDAEEQSQDTNLTEPEAAGQSDAKEEAHEDIQAGSEERESSEAGSENAAAEPDAATESISDETTTEDVEKSADANAAAEEEATNGQEVTKSAIFGDYAEADVAEVSVRALTSELCWQVWRAVYTDEEDERTPQERKAHVAAALAEYSSLVQKVADVFIDNGVDPGVEKTFVIPDVEAVAKSLTDKETRVEELTKSLSDKTTELETVQKYLEETTKKLETIEARKSLAFQSGAKAAVLVDDEVEKSATQEPSIGELYLQKIGALPEAA